MQRTDHAIYDNLFRLRRRFVPRHRLRGALLDTASWVNVVLLVLMFFIGHAGFVLQPGIAVDLPAAPMTGGANYRSFVVTITQEGLIFYNDERVSFDGLAADLLRQAHRDADAALVIEADARVRHSDLVRIYNLAIAAGLQRVVLATRFLEPPATP
jgi:biopolymer transport protein ExbD